MMFFIPVLWALIAFFSTQVGSSPGDSCTPVDTSKFCKDPLTVCHPSSSGEYSCVCMNGYFQLATKCKPFPVNPGDSCDSSIAPCSLIPNSQCIFSSCQCMTGHDHDTVNQRCLKTPKEIGDLCEPSSVSCRSVGGTTCRFRPELGESICECTSPDEVTDIPNRACLKKPLKPGDACTPLLTPCSSVTNTTCTTQGGGPLTCQCVPDLVTNPSKGECLVQPKKPGEICDPTFTPCNLVASTSCDAHPDVSSNQICTCNNAGEVTDYVNFRCLKKPEYPGDLCDPKFTPCNLDPSYLPTTCLSDNGVSSYCKCDTGTVTDFQGRRCLRLPQIPGDECSPNLTPCDSIPDTVCVQDGSQFSCLCNGDLITDKDNGRCLRQPVQLSDPCEPSVAPCLSSPMLECDPTLLQCTCKSPYVPFLGNLTCLSLPQLPGDFCDLATSLTCDNVPAASTCAIDPTTSEFLCMCDNLYLDRPNRRCIPAPQIPLDLCNPITAPCTPVPNTECRSQVGSSDFKCFCNEGFVHDPQARRCVSFPPRRPGDPCEPSAAPCANVNNTLCTWEDTLGHVCKCTGTLVTDKGYCFPLPVKPSDQCSVTLAPCPSITASTCVDSGQLNFFYCKCNGIEVITDPDYGRCIPKPTIPLDPCDPLRVPCPLNSNTECTLNDPTGYHCTCLEGFVHDAAGKRCILPPEVPGDPCEPAVAPCTSINDTSCTADPDDPTRNSCYCINGQVTDLGRCFPPPTRPSHPCSPTQSEGSCPTGIQTECEVYLSPWNNFRCLCSTPGYFTDFPSQSCLLNPTLPGDPCSNTEGDPCPPNSECTPLPFQGNLCVCKQGFFLSESDECLPLPTKPSEFCERDVHCASVPGTLCIANNCECIFGEWDLSSSGPYCVKKATLVEDPCETTLQCSKLNSSSCLEGICDCVLPSFASESKRSCLFPVEELNRPCQETTQCLMGVGEGSICSDFGGIGLCSCEFGFIPSASGEECLKSWSPGEGCSESVQCRLVLGENSLCDAEGRCVCTGDAVLVGSSCRVKTGLGQNCTSSAECAIGTNGFGECYFGFCVCQEEVSYEEVGECWERLRLGSPCVSDIQCVRSLNSPHVFCHTTRKVCSCPLSLPQSSCGSSGVALPTLHVPPTVLFVLWLVIKSISYFKNSLN